MAPLHAPTPPLHAFAANKIIIVHSSALMRLGIATTLREARRLADAQIMEFASVVQGRRGVV